MTPAKIAGSPRPLAVAVFVTVLGPLIGAALYAVPVFGRWALMAFSQFGPPEGETLQSVFSIGLLILVFAYLLGALPALLAGIALGFATHRNGSFSYLLAIAVATAATAVASLIFGLQQGTDMPAGSFAMFPILLWPALFAALIARYFAGRYGWIVHHPQQPRFPA